MKTISIDSIATLSAKEAETLQNAIIEQTSAGTPWLDEE